MITIALVHYTIILLYLHMSEKMLYARDVKEKIRTVCDNKARSSHK